ncbi:cob(I)alamin adenosyltransferase [Paenibacillus forsythiae]|uniref:Cob(I)alamin adenosyltransferase n=1 Tax=Paenibacillus forsythiae TaxID=365616 RepID=A0ABU3HGX8_9BACL|nr:cob(I)yrinic acid a,c-diamide adenosyltransferase [Paenibacillus forsythiae]MDT3428925.1 cob(I)alamin adenosyltransferase [Paenibacillus forsythiae]
MEEPDPRANRKGYTLVYTGDGKGKTTAALGLALRASGRGYKVLILQFIKSPERTCGEHIALRKLGVDIRQLGAGLTWTKTPEEHRSALREAWSSAREEVLGGDWDVVVLDEINNALAIRKFPVEDVLPLGEVLDLIRRRPKHLHLVLTGRQARTEILELADLVSEVQAVKHYYHDGVQAVPGMDY